MAFGSGGGMGDNGAGGSGWAVGIGGGHGE